jgi:hypothetical protein
VGLAATVGTTIEWYDFFLYGFAASLVLGGGPPPRFVASTLDEDATARILGRPA